MSTATAQPKSASPPVSKLQPASSSSAEVCDALVDELRRCQSRAEFYRTALQLLARHFDAPYAAIHIESRAGTIEDQWTHKTDNDENWSKQCTGLLFKSQYQRSPLARMLESSATGWRFAAMAVPVTESEGVIGSIAIVIRCDEKQVAEAKLAELQALISLVGMLANTTTGLSQGQPQANDDTANSSSNDNTGASK